MVLVREVRGETEVVGGEGVFGGVLLAGEFEGFLVAWLALESVALLSG